MGRTAINASVTPLRLAAITLVRDGADVIVPFVEHHLQLLDRMYFIDHLSQDGTRQWLERRGAERDAVGRVEVLHYDQPAYYQSFLSDLVARMAIDEGADWVLFLDVDEFLAVDERRTLEESLRAVSGGLAKFVWSHLIPTALSNELPFDVCQELRTTPTRHRAGRSKIALHRTFAARHRAFRLDGGNHGVRATPHGASLRGERAGTLLHVPIRSRHQLRQKVDVQLASFRATQASAHGIAPHLFRIAATLQHAESGDASGSDRDLIELAVLEYEGVDALAEGLDRSRQETVVLPAMVRAAAERSLRDVASGLGDVVPDNRPPEAAQAAGCGLLGQWRAHRSGCEVRVDPEPFGKVADGLAEVRSRLSPQRFLRRAAGPVLRRLRRRR